MTKNVDVLTKTQKKQTGKAELSGLCENKAT